MSSKIQLAAAAAASTVCLYFCTRIIYLLVFHHLAKYPGPLLAALTEYWYAFAWSSGRYPYLIQAVHQKYGEVVRIGPNKLSFVTVSAYHDIYEHKPLFRKSDWYSGGLPSAIIFEREPAAHAQIRNALKHNFGPRYLRNTAGNIILDLSKMFSRLAGSHDGSKKDSAITVDVCRLFTMFAFDTIGMITLGKSFDSLATDTLHPLAELMHSGAYAATLQPLRHRLWLFDLIVHMRSRGKDPNKLRTHHIAMLKAEVKQRTELGATHDGEDIVAQVIRHKSLDETALISNIVNLFIAGSETVATCLSSVMLLLLQNESCLQKLKSEIRSSFTDVEDITGDTTAKLPYLRAVIDETLRILPPSPFGQSRTSPGATVDGKWILEGVDVSVDIWCLHHSDRYWRDPWSFKPDRWIKVGDDAGNFKDNKEAFRPFSAGSRACIGQSLAYLEIRIMLLKLLWLYEWDLDPRSHGWYENLRLEFMWRKPELLIRFSRRLE
ncbi:cytochrome P450 [Xylariaceae sp. AK1471]|nr:cytochrome P450 [Xylariaceae sp. AK1471]